MDAKTGVYTLHVFSPSGNFELPVTHHVVNESRENMWVTITTKVDGKEICLDAETTEEALFKLAKALPEGCEIMSCLSCRHGNFCPVGDANNEVFCVTDFEPKQKSDLYHVTEDTEERTKRSRTLFHVCQNHMPQSEDYYTYNDYFYKIHNR